MRKPKQRQDSAPQVREVFGIAERNGKSYWIRIGAAFTNQDGSEMILLDALPINGRLHISAKKKKGGTS